MGRSRTAPEIRDAVREQCTQFPDEYFRAIDVQRGYPEAFVDADLDEPDPVVRGRTSAWTAAFVLSARASECVRLVSSTI